MKRPVKTKEHRRILAQVETEKRWSRRRMGRKHFHARLQRRWLTGNRKRERVSERQGKRERGLW